MQKVILLAIAGVLLAGHAQAQIRPGTKTAPKRAVPAATKAPLKRPAAPAPKASTKPAVPPTAPLTPKPAPAPTGQDLSLSKPADRSFHKGSNALNLGIGFGMGYGFGYDSNVSQTPALSLSYMRGVADAGPGTISAGGVLGYKSYSWKYSGGKSTWRDIFVGARGAYHYGFQNSRLDTYAGLGLGLRVVSYSDGSDSALGSGSASGSQAERLRGSALLFYR